MLAHHLADLVSLESFDFEGGERRNERVRKRCEHEDIGYPTRKRSSWKLINFFLSRYHAIE